MERKDWSIVKMNWIPTNLARPAKSGYYIATIDNGIDSFTDYVQYSYEQDLWMSVDRISAWM